MVETGREPGRTLEDLVGVAGRIGASVESVIDGKANAVRLTLAVLLADGHLLIEDVPGVGKTMLAKALARSIDCTVSRIQFANDSGSRSTASRVERSNGSSSCRRCTTKRPVSRSDFASSFPTRRSP